MKSVYKKADAEVVVFDNSDIITISGTNDPFCPQTWDRPGSQCSTGVEGYSLTQ